MFLVFGIAYNMQAEEILKPQRHLLNSKPSGRQSFSCCFAIRIQMTSPIDFFHSACAFFHSFVADQFHDLCFFFFFCYWQTGIKKRGFITRWNRAKVINLLHGNSTGSLVHHSRTWGIALPHNESRKQSLISLYPDFFWKSLIVRTKNNRIWSGDAVNRNIAKGRVSPHTFQEHHTSFSKVQTDLGLPTRKSCVVLHSICQWLVREKCSSDCKNFHHSCTMQQVVHIRETPTSLMHL